MTAFFRFDVAAFDGQVDNLGQAIEDAARPAAQAGAQVLYEEVQRNVGRIKKRSGNLARSIYQVFSKTESRNGAAVYHISWNAKKAPHGHLVEYGHLQRYEVTYDPKTKRFTTHKDRPLATPVQVAARPFVRPAMAKFDAAMEVAKTEFYKRLEARA